LTFAQDMGVSTFFQKKNLGGEIEKKNNSGRIFIYINRLWFYPVRINQLPLSYGSKYCARYNFSRGAR